MAYTNRGLAHKNRRMYDASIADYTAALKLNPTSDAIFTDRGNAHLEKGDYPAAIVVCLRRFTQKQCSC